MAKRDLMYEYVVSSEIQFHGNPGYWEPLVATRDGIAMAIHTPFTGSKVAGIERTYGNEGVHFGYSIFHIVLSVDEDEPNPEWTVPHKLLQECLQWIRVKGLQYWVGTLPMGSKVIARGSIITGENQFTNFAGYTTPLGVTPFTQEMWRWVGEQLAQGRLPTVPDLLMSDALISFAEGDYLQAVIRLGIVCELALNAFIDDLLTIQPEVARKLYDDRKPFKDKLKDVIGILGAERYQDHKPNLFGDLLTLYQLRGTAIHRGKLEVNQKPIDQGHVAQFMWAALDFLSWTQSQRVRLSIPI